MLGMDFTSTSFDFLESDTGGDCTATAYTDMMPASNEYLIGDYGHAEDPHPELLGLIEAQIEFCDQLQYVIEIKRKELAVKKAWLEKEIEQDRRNECAQRNKVPVVQYLPPYFKDENMMCPPQNEEAKHKLQHTTFDPLIKEEKKWTSSELRLLRESVRDSVVQTSIQKFVDRKEILLSKVQRAGVETTPQEREAWKEEIEALDRKIEYSRSRQMDSNEMAGVDYSCVDWLKISNFEFKGTRSATALRYKWLNEQCPRWNTGPWTKQELERLRQLREDESFTSWAVLSKKLGTERSPYQCFERYRSDMYKMAKGWTKEEDDRLVALVKVMTVNGTVQWDKVCFYMPGRHRQQVRTRYLRTLDENIRHGRWTDHEDLLLMSAVARFGAKDWGKVAKCVVGRSDGQCRERWCNVLDVCTETGEWTTEEDERLVFGVQVFGRGQWSKIAEILPRHKPESIRRRYQRLLATKMRLCSAKLVGYPVVRNMSVITAAVHKAKRDVMRQQLTDNGLKGECYRAAKEQAIKNPSTKLANVRQGNKISDEEKAKLEKGIEEITERFRNREHTPSVTDVIKKIDLTQKEVASIITAAKKSTVYERPKRVHRCTSGVKKIRKNMYLLSDTSLERTVFRPEETEEERIICLTEALCHAVRKYDQYEWCNKFFDGREEPENVAADIVNNMLSNRCAEVVNCLKQCIQPPLRTTLATTFTTASAYRVFERARLSLTQRASRFFPPCGIDTTDVLAVQSGDIALEFTVCDRLNIQLHPDILSDDNYLKLKAQVRCILREPTRLAFAIDTPDVEQQRNRTQMELMQAIMDEQACPFEDQWLSNVANEVVIGSTEDWGPIDYEDLADDALNETVHTVVDQVCHRPFKGKRKRGRPSKKDKLLSILAVSEKGEKASKCNRRISPYPPTKKIRLSDGRSFDVRDLEFESGTCANMCSPISHHGETSIEDVEVSPRKDIHEKTTSGTQQVQNVGKACNSTRPSKNKRRKPKKTIAVEDAQNAKG